MIFGLCCPIAVPLSNAQNIQVLPGTAPLVWQGDFAKQMVAGIDGFFTQEIAASVENRKELWHRDFSSHENYGASIAANRDRFKKIIGVVDPREKVSMKLAGTIEKPAFIGQGDGYKIYTVRWQAIKGVDGEGLLLQPDGEVAGNIVALPDCDQLPEMLAGLVPGSPAPSQFARLLVEAGFRVIVPVLINRENTYSGNPDFSMTDQPHREFICRGAYELGRHIIGYEVQKILAAVDWFQEEDKGTLPTGVIGYGEGGLLALYAAAVDTRIDAAAVLGYFQPREQIWREPFYRNVWSLLYEFGDAEIATLVCPRPIVLEACKAPEVVIPFDRPRGSQATPGILTTPATFDVEKEVERAKELVRGLHTAFPIQLVKAPLGIPGCDETLSSLVTSLGVQRNITHGKGLPGKMRAKFNHESRLERQFQQLVNYNQYLMREAEFTRAEFWSRADDSSLQSWQESTKWYRDYFRNEVVGSLPSPTMPENVRSRLVFDEPKYRGYEIVMDVYPGIFNFGILLVPKDIRSGERRPVVVCQHGLDGRPRDVADPSINNRHYHQYACRLAERGFVTYAPQNPYCGRDTFRLLLKKMHPLKKSLFSVIIPQHERMLDWLSGLDFVDPDRIGFYGLSYGGVSAMHIPSVLQKYCLSICSANFNEWVWKKTSLHFTASYMYTVEYDLYMFNMGNTFNYSELAGLICPRPFMVERGHMDGVAPGSWVAYEFAKVRRRFDLLGIGNRAEIEYFSGEHEINATGTFDFLHKHLNWNPDN